MARGTTRGASGHKGSKRWGDSSNGGVDAEKPRAAPNMRRSMGQLSSSYAPMRHFAFENGLGVCLSVPLDGPPLQLDGNTPEQIHRRLREAAQTWFNRGYENIARDSAARAAVLRHLVVDGSLYDPTTGNFEYRRDDFGFAAPRKMGYEVAPTTLVCGTCGLLKPCGSAKQMVDLLDKADTECLDPKRRGPDPKHCRWRQFEPIFIHPSGSWRSVDVSALDLFPGSDETSRRSSSCEACGHRQFKVDMTKVTLSGWFLKCASCGVRTGWTWTDNDEDYLRAQALSGGPGGAIGADAPRMEKISYGAAIAFIPQSESFVDLPDSSELKLIESHRLDELCDFIAKSAGWLAPAPAPADAAVELDKGGEEARRIATRIRRSLVAAEKLRNVDVDTAAEQDQTARDAVAEAIAAKLISVDSALPSHLRAKVGARSTNWASRYDPFQLAVEHAALSETKLSGKMEGARRSYVRFEKPDHGLRSFEDGSAEEAVASKKVQRALALLGMEEAGLIPKFELCRFTYGYSRTASGPVHPKRNVPVRLKLFPRVRLGEHHDLVHPVYVMRQKNEAFYFKLDESRVRRWLAALNCEDGHLLTSEPSLRAALFMSAHPMDRFLTEHDRDRSTPPRLYGAAYGLVHTMAHHVIRTMSRLSGLDEGGLGEYLFPTDLAFTVYRSGMTMDLGDLSSLWRNSWEDFLSELCRYADSLGCNVGSLCAEQGGACPDCMMIPEVVCVAGNRYLSRSLLTGEGQPNFAEYGNNAIQGYLEMKGDSADAGA